MTKPLNVIFYGPGYSFFETALIQRLKVSGLDFNRIILMDPDFAHLIEYSSLVGWDDAVYTEHMAELLPSYLSLAFFRITQILSFLRAIDVDAELYFYARHQDYLEDSALSQQKSDFLIAMDYTNGSSENAAQFAQEYELKELFETCLASGGIIAIAKAAYSLPKDQYLALCRYSQKQ